MPDDIPQPKPLRHYLLVRADLPVRVKFAQIAHAAGESAVLRARPDETTIAVVLEGAAEDFWALLPQLTKGDRDFRHVRVVETEGEYAGQLMAIGLEPTRDNRLRKLLYHFRQAGEDIG